MSDRNENNSYTFLVCVNCQLQYWECDECFVKIQEPKHHRCWENVAAARPYTLLVRHSTACSHPKWIEHSSPAPHDEKICHLCAGYRAPRIFLGNGWEVCAFCKIGRKYRTGYGNRSFTHQFRCPVIRQKQLVPCFCPKTEPVYTP